MSPQLMQLHPHGHNQNVLEQLAAQSALDLERFSKESTRVLLLRYSMMDMTS
jgi:hypothetical protein